jgi:hypothetical protein
MRDAAREELKAKELCERFSFIHADYVSASYQNDDVRNIPVSFFDSINGIE